MARRTRQFTVDDFSGGWNTEQDRFNASPNSILLPKNSYLSRGGTALNKRQGISNFLTSAFSQNAPVITNLRFTNPSGEDERIVQIEDEVWRIKPDGSKTLLREMNSERKLGTTVFNERLIMGSRDIDPFKYLYVSTPLNPTTETVSTTGMDERIYFVRISYSTDNGETPASSPTEVELGSDELLRVTPPAQPDGATSWNVYLGESYGEMVLQEDDIPFDASFIEPASGFESAGDAPPDTNTAWAVEDLGGEPPRADVWHTHNNRVYAGKTHNDRTTLHYCALDNEDSWGQQGTPAGNGIWELGAKINRADEIMAMENTEAVLVVLFQRWLILLSAPENADGQYVEQVLQGKGAIARDGVIGLGNDVFWLSEHGVQALSQESGMFNMLLDDENPSSPINNHLTEEVGRIQDQGTEQGIDVIYYHPMNWLVWLVPEWGSEDTVGDTRMYVHDLSNGAWTWFKGPVPSSMSVSRDGVWTIGIQGDVLEFFDGSHDDRGEDIQFLYSSQWLYLGNRELVKKGKWLFFAVESGEETEVNIRYDWDYGQEKGSFDEMTVTVDAEGVDYWDEDLWDTQPWIDTTRIMERIPIYGRGRALKVVFEEESSTSFSLPFYGVEVLPSGVRKAV